MERSKKEKKVTKKNKLKKLATKVSKQELNEPSKKNQHEEVPSSNDEAQLLDKKTETLIGLKFFLFSHYAFFKPKKDPIISIKITSNDVFIISSSYPVNLLNNINI
ncbi:hypothetical protein BpHYR1_032614 [Brachionus plicatilis]|uniref:Uncharacterized protein n=1 Tax=Brachionus plicatilis TaxID=10195 RepID=A0A3M7R8D4_BRAPC|nr:hypothetical protein BpHYR1_032614 [Brachionus plicatilis]